MRQKSLPLLIACGLAVVLATSPAFASEDCNCNKPTIIEAGTTAATGSSVSKIKAKHSVKAKARAKSKTKANRAVSVQRGKRTSYRVAPAKVVWAKDAKTHCAEFGHTGNLSCACDDQGIGTRVSAPRIAMKASEWERVK